MLHVPAFICFSSLLLSVYIFVYSSFILFNALMILVRVRRQFAVRRYGHFLQSIFIIYYFSSQLLFATTNWRHTGYLNLKWTRNMISAGHLKPKIQTYVHGTKHWFHQSFFFEWQGNLDWGVSLYIWLNSKASQLAIQLKQSYHQDLNFHVCSL